MIADGRLPPLLHVKLRSCTTHTSRFSKATSFLFLSALKRKSGRDREKTIRRDFWRPHPSPPRQCHFCDWQRSNNWDRRWWGDGEQEQTYKGFPLSSSLPGFGFCFRPPQSNRIHFLAISLWLFMCTIGWAQDRSSKMNVVRRFPVSERWYCEEKIQLKDE